MMRNFGFNKFLSYVRFVKVIEQSYSPDPAYNVVLVGRFHVFLPLGEWFFPLGRRAVAARRLQLPLEDTVVGSGLFRRCVLEEADVEVGDGANATQLRQVKLLLVAEVK